MTISEIEEQFKSEWILIGDPETNEALEVVRGKVLCHSKERDGVYRKAIELHPRHSAFLYTGPVLPEGTQIILRVFPSMVAAGALFPCAVPFRKGRTMLLEAREMAAKLLRTVLLFGAAVALGCGNNAFRFLVTFPQAPGIKKGSEVRYLGLKVGEVESVLIQPSENGGAPRVAVAVALKGLNAVQIRREDRFSVGLQGLLGEAYLDISPGPQSAPAIPAGSTVSAELVALAPQTASGFIDAISLAAKLNSLPEDKRRELLQTFNKMLDDAINQQNQVPFSPQESRKPHK